MFNYQDFCIAILITIIPVFIFKYRKLEINDSKMKIIYSGIWMVIASVLSYIASKSMNGKVVLETLLPTCIISSIIDYFIIDDKINLPKAGLAILILIGFFFSSLIQLPIMFILGLTRENISANANANTEVFLAIVSDLFLLVILIAIYFEDLKKDFLVFKKKYNEYLDTSFKYYFIGLLVMALSNVLINTLTPSNIASNEESVQAMIKASPFLTLICTGILAPFVEELIFRKSFRDAFNSKALFIVVSSLVFGGLHVILTLKHLYELLYLIPYCSLGVAFCYSYVKTNNIFTTISLHAIHNTVITVMSIVSYLCMVMFI